MSAMVRRLIAVVGILALALMYLPGLVADISASTQPACCDGATCPMHHIAGAQVECDINTGRPSGSLRSCSDLAPRYTAALVFVPVAPSVFFAERPIAAAPVLISDKPGNADLGVVIPPPRPSLA